MARYKDTEVTALVQPQLQPGEQLKHWAYGVKQPPVYLMFVITPLGTALLTKEYVVALTDQRFLVLRTKGKTRVEEVIEYPLNRLPPVKTSTGALFTHIKVEDAAKPFVAKFHRMGMSNNREHAMAIAAALGNTA